MSVETIERLVARAVRFQSETAAPRLLISAHEVIANIREPEFAVHGLFEKNTVASLVAPWGGGKTAVAIDLGLRIAAQMAVHGRVTSGGFVVFVIGEGHAGFGRRLNAWSAANHRDLRNVPFYLSTRAVLMLDADAPQRLFDEISQLADHHDAPPAVIMLDTLARNLGGDENSTADMGRFVDAIDRYLRRPFGACVLVLHHPGHSEKSRGRGASAFPAAVDVEYLLERTDDVLRLTVGKPPKDFEPPEAMCWRLRPVPLVINGHAASGITVEEIQSIDTPVPSFSGLGPSQRQMLDILNAELSKRQATLEGASHDPKTARLAVDEWRNLGTKDGAISEHRNSFYKVRDALIERKLVVINDGYVSAAT